MQLSITYSNWSFILVSSIFLVITLITAIGNALVFAALFRFKRLRTTSNFLIGNLALSDLLLAITVLPFSAAMDATGIWLFGPILCNIWLTIDVFYCTASVWSLVAIAFDRFTATTFPIWYRGHQTKTRIISYTVLVWIFSGFICLPGFLGWGSTDVGSLTMSNRSMVSKEIRTKSTSTHVYVMEHKHFDCVLFTESHYVVYSAIGSFILPLFIMIGLYTKIFVTLQNRMQLLKGHRNVANKKLHCSPTKIDDQVTSSSLTNYQSPDLNTDKMDSEYVNQSTDSIKQTNDNSHYSVTSEIYSQTNSIVCICCTSSAYCNRHHYHHNMNLCTCCTSKCFSGKFVWCNLSTLFSDQKRTTRANYEIVGTTTTNNLNNMEVKGSELDCRHDHNDSNLKCITLTNSHIPIIQLNYDEICKHGNAVSMIDEDRSDSNENHDNDTHISIQNTKTTISSNSCSSVDNEQNTTGDIYTENEIATKSLSKQTKSAITNQLFECCKNRQNSNRMSSNSSRAPMRNANKPTRHLPQPKVDIKKSNSEYVVDKVEQRERRATKRMALIIFIFVLCWIPFTLMYLVRGLCGNDACPDIPDLRKVVTWLGYANSTINPILYAVFNRDFRKAFSTILNCSKLQQMSFFGLRKSHRSLKR